MDILPKLRQDAVLLIKTMQEAHNLLTINLYEEIVPFQPPSFDTDLKLSLPNQVDYNDDDDDISWFFEDNLGDVKSSEVNGSSKQCVGGEFFSDVKIIQSLIIDTDNIEFLPNDDRPLSLLQEFLRLSAIGLWKHLLSSSYCTANRPPEHFISSLIASFHPSLVHFGGEIDDSREAMVDGALTSSIADQLQIKYVKGIHFNKTILVQNAIMINSYYEVTSSVFEYHLQRRPEDDIHYIQGIDFEGQLTRLPGMKCSRILLYHSDSDNEWWSYLNRSHHFQYETQDGVRRLTISSDKEFVLYNHLSQQFLVDMKTHFQYLHIDTILCYGVIMNNHELQSKIQDLSKELQILFISITNHSDINKLKSFLAMELMNFEFSQHLLTCREEDLCIRSMTFAQYTPIYDLTAVYRRQGYAGLEIGEFRMNQQYFQENQNDGEESEVMNESISFGNNDYDCLLFLQWTNITQEIDNQLLLKPSSVSILLTASTMIYLQSLYYQFIRGLHRIRQLILHGGKVIIGPFYPEILQSFLIERMKYEMLSKDYDETYLVEVLDEFKKGLENFPRVLMKNNGLELREIEKYIDQLKEKVTGHFEMNPPQQTNRSIGSHSPIFDDFHQGMAVFELPQVKIRALEKAITLVLRLLSMTPIQ